MTSPTLLDIAKKNGSDTVVGLVEETIKFVPEISGVTMEGKTIPGVGAARTIKGTQYKTLVRTGLPTVGFRDANEGVTASKSTYENRLVETFILNPRWECDKAVADASEDGPEAFIAMEAGAIMAAAMQALGSQFFYGRGSADAKGHPGLVDSVLSTYTQDRAGSGSACGSVYAVKFGPQHVQWVYGQNGQLVTPDVRIETLLDSSNRKYTGYVQDMLAYVGVQVASVYSIGRVKNVTAAVPLRDSDLYALLAKMKIVPDVLFMNRTLLEQLRASRTATNATGAPAPRPTDVDGIPIAATESLTFTETAA